MDKTLSVTLDSLSEKGVVHLTDSQQLQFQNLWSISGF